MVLYEKWFHAVLDFCQGKVHKGNSFTVCGRLSRIPKCPYSNSGHQILMQQPEIIGALRLEKILTNEALISLVYVFGVVYGSILPPLHDKRCNCKRPPLCSTCRPVISKPSKKSGFNPDI